MRSLYAALCGAALGYLACTVVANLEDFQFYTIRSWATGKTAMSDIVRHPADRWACMLMVLGPVVGGAIAAIALERQLR